MEAAMQPLTETQRELAKLLATPWRHAYISRKPHSGDLWLRCRLLSVGEYCNMQHVTEADWQALRVHELIIGGDAHEPGQWTASDKCKDLFGRHR